MDTKSREEHLETLGEIRTLMEQSARFISLSGLSGIAAGTFALIGAFLAFQYLNLTPFEAHKVYYAPSPGYSKWGLSFYQFFLLNAIGIMVLAFGGAIFFTTRKAKRKGQKIWDKLTLRLLVNLGIPLIVGAIFCLALLKYGLLGIIAPTTLIFYGLALVNASKYTLNDIRYLGISEILLGCISLFNPGYGLEIWAIGFGILHIVYGALMYYRHDSTVNN